MLATTPYRKGVTDGPRLCDPGSPVDVTVADVKLIGEIGTCPSRDLIHGWPTSDNTRGHDLLLR